MLLSHIQDKYKEKKTLWHILVKLLKDKGEKVI